MENNANMTGQNVARKFSKKQLLILGLVLLAIGVGIFLFLRRNKVNYEQASLVKTELYVDPKVEDLASFVSELPYETEGFMIEYYPNSGFYFITLRGKTDQEVNSNKNSANDWIVSHKAFSVQNSFCGQKYQIVLPPKGDNIEVTNLESQLTMPGCHFAKPEYIKP